MLNWRSVMFVSSVLSELLTRHCVCRPCACFDLVWPCLGFFCCFRLSLLMSLFSFLTVFTSHILSLIFCQCYTNIKHHDMTCMLCFYTRVHFAEMWLSCYLMFSFAGCEDMSLSLLVMLCQASNGNWTFALSVRAHLDWGHVTDFPSHCWAITWLCRHYMYELQSNWLKPC